MGIIALFAYNYLANRIKGIVNRSEMRIMDFMDILNEPAAKRGKLLRHGTKTAI